MVTWWLLCLWLTVEAAFLAWNLVRYRRCNALRAEPYDRGQVARAMARFLGLVRSLDLRAFVAGWFRGAPFEAIRRGNFEELMAYGFYLRRPEELPAEDRAALAEWLDAAEAAWGLALPPGRNPDVRFMAPAWEPLRVWHRPLAAYLLVEAVNLAAGWALRRRGFVRLQYEGLVYWLRQPPARGQGSVAEPLARGESFQDEPLPPAQEAAAASATPVVFLHGLGIGLAPYLAMIQALVRTYRHHPALLVEFPHVSLRLVRRGRPIDELARAVRAMLKRHGYTRACLVAHSWGSMVASRFAQQHPQAVAGLVLIDAVCLLPLHPLLPHMCFYAPLRLPTTSVADALGVLVRRLVFRDLLICQFSCRGFIWHQLMLWPEDMPASTLILLSGNDDLIPTDVVRAHLEAAPGCPAVLVHPTAQHGHIVADKAWQLAFIGNVWPLLREGPAAAARGVPAAGLASSAQDRNFRRSQTMAPRTLQGMRTLSRSFRESILRVARHTD